MRNVYIAFYKHKRKCSSLRDTFYRIGDEIIRFCTNGKYSHCEIVCPYLEQDGNLLFECYSSSIMDGGVRLKLMPLPVEKWDLVKVNIDINLIRLFYNRTKGAKYDILGAIGVILPVGENKRRYFCSEWCASAIELANPRKYSPNSLYQKLTEKV